MDTLCAFSSDSRELYKADIYRVLALPDNYIVHFRYKTKYVDENILSNINSIADKKVAICFTHGNEIGGQNNNYTHVSVRWAHVSKFEVCEETDVFHVYMKLNNFCNLSIDSNNSSEKQVPNKFFSNLNCTELSNENSWSSRVNVLHEYFDDVIFFHLKGIKKIGCFEKLNHDEKVKYANYGKFSSFSLNHGCRYILKMAISNPKSCNTKLNIKESSEEIMIGCISPIETTVLFDDYDIPISVKSLQTIKQATMLQFQLEEPKEKSDDKLTQYTTSVELDLKMSFITPIGFGLLSLMGFWALIIILKFANASACPSIWLIVISSVMFFISSGSLFYWFNKK